jgi:hypothetical protein
MKIFLRNSSILLLYTFYKVYLAELNILFNIVTNQIIVLDFYPSKNKKCTKVKTCNNILSIYKQL